MFVGFVDDEQFVLKSTANIISKAMPEIQIAFLAKNGLEAWELIQQTHTDVIITDVKMPVMDGIELCRLIYENNCDTEVILLSGYSEFDYVKKAMDYNARKYILKPLSKERVDEIVSTLKEIAEQRELKHSGFNNIDVFVLYEKINALIKCGDFESIHQIINDDKNKKNIKNFIEYLINVLTFIISANNLNISGRENMYEKLNSLPNEETKLEYVSKRYDEVISQFTAKENRDNAGTDGDKAAQIREYIDDNYSDPNIGRDFLADKFGISGRHLTRLFSVAYGMGVRDYIESVRLEKVKQLLKETQLSVERIAKLTGYNSADYLRRLVKKRTGYSPFEYRTKDNDDV